MRFLLDLLLAMAIALVAGLGTAWIALDGGRLFGTATLGEWTAWPRSGGPAADPYSSASLARSGEVPLGAGEGLAFSAEADSDGVALTGRCTYVLVGQTPPARLWTLAAYDGDGHLMDNAAHRFGFHSREILRRGDGSFEIALATAAQPGNWLPIAPVEHFRLVLRLYDTPLASGGIEGQTMPRIVRGSCL